MVAALALGIASYLSVAIYTPTAFAQDSDLRAKARVLTSEGQELQKAGDYAEAEAKYRAAYKLIPHPVLLFNIAQVNRLAGKKVPAVRFYRQFVAIGQNDKLVAEARRHLAVLEPQVGEIPDIDPTEEDGQGSTGSSDQVVDGDATDATDRGDRGDQNLDGLDTTSVTEVGPLIREAPATDEGKLLRISGVVAASLGVVAIGGGIYYGLRARRFSRDLSKTNPDAWTPAEIRKDKNGKKAERNMIILTAVGGAAVTTGVILYIIGRKKDHSDSLATVVPATDGDSLSVVFSGRF